MMTKQWHAIDIHSACDALDTHSSGLTSQEAARRLKQYGPNSIQKLESFRFWKILLRQLSSPLALILMAAAGATFFLGEYVDGFVVIVALAINVALGVYQEGRASHVFDELTEALETHATVIRDGVQREIPAHEVVIGDILVLETGKSIPADGRLIEQFNLAANESSFTGEWVPVQKDTEKSMVAEPRSAHNLVWSGTIVADGTGKAVVYATGQDTGFGKLADQVQKVDETETPLMKSVKKLAHAMVFLILGVLVITIVFGLIRGGSFHDMLLIAIAVAVAAMPEGLPAAITVVLAVAMEAILRKGGLVKSLIAAETLGSTTTILTDKTGTLTQAEMKVAAVYSVPGARSNDSSPETADNLEVIRGAVLASDSYIDEVDGESIVRGRPVERAVIMAGMDAGITQNKLLGKGYDRVDFLPFSSARRYAGSLNREQDGSLVMYLSGAPERLLEHAAYFMGGGKKQVLTDADRILLTDIQKKASGEGMRFIGVARFAIHGSNIPPEVHTGNPSNLEFLGFIALADTVRPDVKAQIQRAHEANVRVIMVTGDYPETARAIADEVGIASRRSELLTGAQIEELSDNELAERLEGIRIVARALPETKLRIARVLRACNHVVAMTGDGVNDAPALMAADIGVAVGSGTDVAKSASDMILLNNTFSTITVAIEEGRRAVDNLRKAVLYLLSTSVSEVVIITGSVLAGLPLPLLPTQLLWTNIIHEGLMSAPYAFEPAQKDVMRRHPRGIHEAILTKHLKILIGIISVMGGLAIFGFYVYLSSTTLPLEKIRTLVFGALSLLALSYALSLKNVHQPLWRINLFDNKALIGALFGSLGILVLSLALPPLRNLLSLTTLTVSDVVLLALFAIVSIVTMEIAKFLARHTQVRT